MGKHKIKAIRLTFLNAFMILLSAILYGFMLYASNIVSTRYEELMVNTQHYIDSQNSAAMVREASDYLTEQVRLYVQNMNPQHANLYFTEANITQRRETALTELESYTSTPELSASLQSAVQCSQALMEREIYAMKLIASANRHPDSNLPIEVLNTTLKPSDTALSPQQMIETARALVFDQGYQDAKAEIVGHVQSFTNGILHFTQTQQVTSAQSLSQAIAVQRSLLTVLVIVNVATFLMLTFLVVKPLRLFLAGVKNQTLFPLTGAYECQYLAHVYNDIYLRNQASAANEVLLRYKAEHDPLTGLLNRSVFNQLHTLLQDELYPVALLLIDADKFKTINDHYGHETGDRVLRRIAAHLTETFRPQDLLFRIGGDEFAVVVTEFDPAHQSVLSDKIKTLNNRLSIPPDDRTPPVSISVGAVFAQESCHQKDLYCQADQALYRVKETGRCGCCFYHQLHPSSPCSPAPPDIP